MNCNCSRCIEKNKYLHTIPENRDLMLYPIIMKDNNFLFYPEIKDSRLICNNLNITLIIPRTINYLHLIELDISNNNIKVIPYIPSIKILKCNNCGLTELPYLPNLEYLECAQNKLLEIPNYKNITYLNCSDNYIKKINTRAQSTNATTSTTPHKLQKLICNNNLISDINIKSLKYLEAKKCPILVIYKLPLINKRSSLILDRKLLFITSHGQYIDEKYVLVNWYNKKLNSNINIKKFNKFTQNILKYLFLL